MVNFKGLCCLLKFLIEVFIDFINYGIHFLIKSLELGNKSKSRRFEGWGRISVWNFNFETEN